MTKGIVIVASVKEVFKRLALNLIDSLDDYAPDIPIFVSTIPEWADEFKDYDNVVEIRSDGPNNIRNKLWALQHSPFDISCYMDADMEAKSERVNEVFDLLDDDHDFAFTNIYAQTGASTMLYQEDYEKDPEWRDNDGVRHLRHHGGFFLWNKNKPNAALAAKRWWELWQEINENDEWWDNHPEFYRGNQSWDQFSWWWLCNKDIPDLKVQEIEDDTYYQYQWNWCPGIPRWHTDPVPEDFEIILYHYPAHQIKQKME